MAELLIKWYETTTYDKGDIVVVEEDGFEWGIDENPLTATNKHFVVLKVPEVTVEQALQYLDGHYDGDFSDPENPPNLLNKRIWNLDQNEIPEVVKTQVQTDGFVTVTKSKLLTYLKNKGVV